MLALCPFGVPNVNNSKPLFAINPLGRSSAIVSFCLDGAVVEKALFARKPVDEEVVALKRCDAVFWSRQRGVRNMNARRRMSTNLYTSFIYVRYLESSALPPRCYRMKSSWAGPSAQEPAEPRPLPFSLTIITTSAIKLRSQSSPTLSHATCDNDSFDSIGGNVAQVWNLSKVTGGNSGFRLRLWVSRHPTALQSRHLFQRDGDVFCSSHYLTLVG